MSNLKYRILAIVGLCVLSIWALFPRDVKIRQRGSDGVLRDVVQRRVPLRKGLDLQGGTYLSLEVDESKQAIPADKIPEAIDRALKTVRNRIEGIGVSEAVVQKQGNDRIVVQIPGIQDPERARQIVQEQAFRSDHQGQGTRRRRHGNHARCHTARVEGASGFAH